MTAQTQISFDRLLNEWNRHEALRRLGADVQTLGQSRFQLDDARRELRSAA
ncbi:MAG: hypothetical protein IH951_10005 [Bacteroidetes bacterium]|nr:hypothetical protein [Bacteroidota bacterium]